MVPERLGIRLTDELGLFVRNHLCWDKGSSYTPDSTDRRRHNAWESIYWCVNDPQQYFFNGDDARVPYDTDKVIDKRHPRHFQLDGGKGRQFEYYSKGGMSIRNPRCKIPSDVLSVNRAGALPKLRGEAKHTAHYPMELVRELLKGVVDDDFLVIDPFVGSGQTGIAAAERNCRFIGYDISQSFCRLARRRLSEVY